MLVLSRRPGEEIIIAGNIRVTVVSVKGDRVRIGIDAPSDVPVDRAEIHARRAEFQEVSIQIGGDAEGRTVISQKLRNLRIRASEEQLALSEREDHDTVLSETRFERGLGELEKLDKDVPMPPSSQQEFSNNPADYAGRWIAWDADRKSIIAVADDYLSVMNETDELGERDPWIERAAELRTEDGDVLRDGESSNIVNDIASTIPDAKEWLETPNVQLGGKYPRDLIGTPDERYLREILRRLWSGCFS